MRIMSKYINNIIHETKIMIHKSRIQKLEEEKNMAKTSELDELIDTSIKIGKDFFTSARNKALAIIEDLEKSIPHEKDVATVTDINEAQKKHFSACVTVRRSISAETQEEADAILMEKVTKLIDF